MSEAVSRISICVLSQKAIVKITPGSFAVGKIADLPGAISGAIALVGGRVYFGIRPHLWSVGIWAPPTKALGAIHADTWGP